MANENVQAYLEKLKKRLELIIISILVILLVAIFWIQSIERDLKGPDPKDIPVAKFQPMPTANFDAVKKFFAVKSNIEKGDRFDCLLNFNIFQVLSAQDRETLEREARAKYLVAEKLFGERKYQEARKICVDILAEVPWFANAQKLLRDINQLAPVAPAPPVPAPGGAPAGGAAPAPGGAPAPAGRAAPAPGGVPAPAGGAPAGGAAPAPGGAPAGGAAPAAGRPSAGPSGK